MKSSGESNWSREGSAKHVRKIGSGLKSILRGPRGWMQELQASKSLNRVLAASSSLWFLERLSSISTPGRRELEGVQGFVNLKLCDSIYGVCPSLLWKPV